MSHRKFTRKTLGAGFLAIFACFAFAPTLHFGAMTRHSPQLSQAKVLSAKTLARNDQPAPNLSASQPQPTHFHKTQDAQAPASPAPSEQQPASAEQPPAPKRVKFDGYTTFAMNETGSHPPFDHISDTWLFGAVGGAETSGSAYPSAAIGHTFMGHTFRPQISSTDGPSGSGPSGPNSNLTPNDQPPQVCATCDNPGDTKPVASVPEPSALALLGVGVCALIAARRLV